MTFPSGGYPGGLDGGEHSDVHLWYQGTLNTDVVAAMGGTVYDGSYSFNAETDGWYGGSNPSETTSGYYFSRIDGGDRTSSAASGGLLWSDPEPLRTPVTLNVPETSAWDNVEISSLQQDSSLDQGTALPVDLKYEAFGNTQIIVGFDTDANPYDGTPGGLQWPVSVNSSDGDTFSSAATTLSTAGLTPGDSYYVYAEITNGGNTRYYYATGAVTINPPAQQTLTISSVTPSALQVLEQGQSLTYTITVDDGSGHAVNGASVYVDDDVQGTCSLPLTTNGNGQATYTTTVPGAESSGTYDIVFTASMSGYTGGAAVTREVEVPGPQTIVYWGGGPLGTGTNWNTPANWVGGVVPGPGDDVVINAPAGITVNYSGGTDAIESLYSSSPLTLSGGSLTVAATVEVNNTFALSGGTLSGATILPGSGALVSSGGTLNGVTLAANLAVSYETSLNVENGLTLNGATVTLLGGYNNYPWGVTYATLVFEGTQTLGGTGQVVFAGNSYNMVYAQGGNSVSTAAVLTIGSGVTVHCGGGGGALQAYYNQDSIVNLGTIIADTSGMSLVISAAGSFRNQGTLSALGGILGLNGTWSNTGTILAMAGTVNLGGTWSNTGTMTATNSTLNLGGTFTTVAISSSGGTVNLTGTVNNVGSTLTLSQSWNLSGGTINGGTVAASGVAELVSSGGTLNGVTLAANLAVSYETSLNVENGLTLNGATVTLLGGYNNYPWGVTYATLVFEGTQTLGGTGQVVFAGNSYNMVYAQGGNSVSTAAVLTIGSGVTVHCGGGGGALQAYYNQDSIVNLGTIIADTSGMSLVISAAGSFRNQGTLSALGGILGLNGTWSNTGTILAMAGTVNLGGTWSNTGTMTATNSTLNLGGTFTTVAISSSGGTVNLTGTLNNAGSTLTLSQSWNLSGGTINGGTVAASGVAELVSSGGTLNGVTLAANLAVSYETSLNVENGLTLNGATVTLLGGYNNYPWGVTYATLVFEGTQTLGGTGQVVFAGNSYNMVYAQGGNSVSTAAVLTIGSGVTVHCGGGGGALQAYYNQDSIVNLGTIIADTSGMSLVISAAGSFRNQGTLSALGGILGLNGTWSNTGTILAMAGTVNLGGTWSNTGTISSSGGTLNLTGTMNNTGTISQTATGTFAMQSGSTLNNLAAGLYNMQGNAQITGNSGSTINNAGTFRKSAGTGTSTISHSIAINNTGTVEVDSGTLILGSGSTALTVTPNNQTKTYGQTFIAFTGNIVGIKSGENVTAVYGSAGAAVGAGVSGSPYAISTTLMDPTNQLSNYTVTIHTASLTVTAATLTVTASSTSKTGGQTLTFAGTEFATSGLANGDSVTSVTLASAGTAASAAPGTYPIVPSAAVGSGLNNYTIVYVPGTLTVTPEPAPVVTALLVENGLTERSYVDQLTLEFNEPVTATAAVPMALTEFDTQGNLVGSVALMPGEFQWSKAPGNGDSVLTWSLESFTGGTASLPDGYYQLTLFASQIVDQYGVPLSGDYTADFFVLQGNVNGDGAVDNNDMAAVNAVLGSRPGSANWNPNADLNRNGTVTTSDRIIVYENMGHGITPPAPRIQVTPAAAASLPAWSFDGPTNLATINALPDGSPVSGILFNADAGALVLDGNAVELGGDIANQSPNTQAINLPLTLIGSQTIDTALGNVTIAGNIGQSGGGWGITKTGPGTLLLSGANSYSGETTVNQGTLVATNTSALPAGTSLIVGAGAVFVFDPSQAASASAVVSPLSPGEGVRAVSDPAVASPLPPGEGQGVRAISAAIVANVADGDYFSRQAGSLSYGSRQAGILSYGSRQAGNLSYGSRQAGSLSYGAHDAVLKSRNTRPAGAAAFWAAENGKSNWNCGPVEKAVDAVMAMLERMQTR